MTQTQLAKLTQCSQSHLSRIMDPDTTGKRPSYSVAKRLASLTGVPMEVWMEGTSQQIKAALADADAKKAVTNE